MHRMLRHRARLHRPHGCLGAAVAAQAAAWNLRLYKLNFDEFCMCIAELDRLQPPSWPLDTCEGEQLNDVYKSSACLNFPFDQYLPGALDARGRRARPHALIILIASIDRSISIYIGQR